MRRILAAYIGVEPAALEFEEAPPGGKPAFREAPPFNFSRSGGVAVLAVAASGRVGVDIEALKPGDFDGVVLAQFSAAERLELERLPEDLRLSAFYRGWTLKEALVKATGEGLNDRLAAMTVQLDPRLPAEIVDGPSGYRPGDWRLMTFRPAEDVCGALAADHAIAHIVCRVLAA